MNTTYFEELPNLKVIDLERLKRTLINYPERSLEACCCVAGVTTKRLIHEMKQEPGLRELVITYLNARHQAIIELERIKGVYA